MEVYSFKHVFSCSWGCNSLIMSYFTFHSVWACLHAGYQSRSSNECLRKSTPLHLKAQMTIIYQTSQMKLAPSGLNTMLSSFHKVQIRCIICTVWHLSQFFEKLPYLYNSVYCVFLHSVVCTFFSCLSIKWKTTFFLLLFLQTNLSTDNEKWGSAALSHFFLIIKRPESYSTGIPQTLLNSINSLIVFFLNFVFLKKMMSENTKRGKPHRPDMQPAWNVLFPSLHFSIKYSLLCWILSSHLHDNYTCLM